MYNKIGIAIAFSPRCEAIINEAAFLQQSFGAQIVLIHIGDKSDNDIKYLEQLVADSSMDSSVVKIVWENGDPADKITNICQKEQIDLLVAGALQRENIVKHYIGSIGRKIMRNADCSILSLINPRIKTPSFDKIIIDGTEGVKNIKTIQRGLRIASSLQARQVHIFKAIPAYGLSMVAAEEETETEYTETKRHIVKQELDLMNTIVNGLDKDVSLKINVKVAAGKPAFQLRRFAEITHADLVILQAPDHQHNILDRLFPNYVDQIIDYLPSNLLIDRHK